MEIADRIGQPLRSDLDVVCTVARESDVPVWLVGGPVRDALLRREVRDLDFLVETRLDEMVRTIATRLGGATRFYPEFLTASITMPDGRVLDMTTAREEIYERPGALPVVRPSTIENDLRRRDFTINAIAWNCLSGEILDPFEGCRDLEVELIRVLHPASFVDDPTRIFRAIRLATRLRFDLEPATEALLRDAIASGAINTVSTQRIWREVSFAFEEDDTSGVLARLEEREVLSQWLGASHPPAGAFETVERLATLIGSKTGRLDVEILRLAFLLSRFEPAPAPPIELSSRRAALLRRIVERTEARHEQWDALEDPVARGRFCLEQSPEEMIAIALCAADEGTAAAIVEACREVRAQTLPFSGADLEVEPGPHVALALRDARVRAWIEEPEPEELLSFAREAALRYLRDWNDAIE